MEVLTPIISVAEGIRKSEANLNAILNHADSGYALYGSDLRIIAFNALAQKFSQLLYKKDLAEGKHLLSYFPENRHDTLVEITKRVLKGEEIVYEINFNLNEGEKWFEVKWLNVKNLENKNWGFILASKNITESKLAALKMEKITNDLVRRNKAVEQFAHVISHNLKAPVANIINLAELMELADGDEEKHQFLNFILESSQALKKVIEEIYQILQVKQQFKEVKEKVCFEQLLNDIKISINHLIKKENTIIRANFDCAPYIYSFRSFIYSVFYNLILNSIKYRRLDVAPIIELTSRICNNHLVLIFSDNGKGIDMQKNGENLFGLYKRFDSSVEGTGLGLFMIKSQIDDLGGTICAESQLGKGTTFTIALPI